MTLSLPSSWHLADPVRGLRNYISIAAHLGDSIFADFAPLLGPSLARSPDPDMALNHLERFLAQPSAMPFVPGLIEGRGQGLDGLLQLLSISQLFADTLTAYPDAVAAVLNPPRRNPSTVDLTTELRNAVAGAFDDAGVLHAFRRFRQLQMLRVGVNDILRDRPLDDITRELSRVADVCVEVAVQTATASLFRKYGTPMTPSGHPARLSALAFGKHGGEELNYSSDIDLMFVYDEDGQTAGSRTEAVPNSELFGRVVSEVARLLSTHTDRGFAYRVDLRLRPGGHRGPPARSLAGTLSYYDVMGRTWERQALIKLRPVAGDQSLGREFLSAISPFIYRKYFSFSEINEIKALKRQMEQRATAAGADHHDVKTGHGGIRDIEYTVQFLQLLNGGDLPAVRQRNTLLAIESLEIAGCLTAQETYHLAEAYRFLRKTEHRLQLLFDRQTHTLPTTPDELHKIAKRMGYATPTRSVSASAPIRDEAVPEPEKIGAAPEQEDEDEEAARREAVLTAQRRSPLDEAPPPTLDTRALLIDPLDRFLKDYSDKTRLNRAILDHLLHQTFANDAERSEPETDLILLQEPEETTIRAALSRYPFRDHLAAYANLMKLAQESVPFLSHRRCRHFLAGIAPQLLATLAEVPDPDSALNNLERVTASLGGKAVLYELFSFNPPSLRLYVDLCASSPFLCGILINNPGMIDELLDTLILDQPRSAEELRAELTELLRRATDPDPILHSFQDKELLRIGVRELLRRDTIRETTASLSDLAETMLNGVCDSVEDEMHAKYGVPTLDADGRPCEWVILGLGKLGGREISFHSDLDLILLYQADGSTRHPSTKPTAPVTTNFHFFTELAQRTIRVLSQSGPLGRLYKVDMRLRPTGQSGSLVIPLAKFQHYFAGEDAQLWERQSLTRARVVRGSSGFAVQVEAAVREAMLSAQWSEKESRSVRTMRERLEAAAPPRSLKHGPGGLTDIEFLVQSLQLQHGRDHPAILQPNICDALDALTTASLLPPTDAETLNRGYTFLREVTAKLRILTDRSMNEVPDAMSDREKLARRMGFDSATTFREKLKQVTEEVRTVFLRRI